MIILYYDELINLEPAQYLNVELINCYIEEENKDSCLKIIKQLKNAKAGYVITRKKNIYQSDNFNKYFFLDIYPASNFGYKNYISIDKKTLVIFELSLCDMRCGNCVSCFNYEYLTENPQIETLIINKIGKGGNVILNNLPFSLLHLRVGEAIENEDYELNNLPVTLQKLELYDQKIIDSDKIKLPIDCVLSLIVPI